MVKYILFIFNLLCSVSTIHQDYITYMRHRPSPVSSVILARHNIITLVRFKLVFIKLSFLVIFGETRGLQTG